MSSPSISDPAASLSLLIVEEDPAQRRILEQAAREVFPQVYLAGDVETGWQIANALPALHGVVLGCEEESLELALQLRDVLLEHFEALEVGLSAGFDFAPHFGRMRGEKLFSKPVDLAAYSAWLGKVMARAAARAAEAAPAEAPSTEAVGGEEPQPEIPDPLEGDVSPHEEPLLHEEGFPGSAGDGDETEHPVEHGEEAAPANPAEPLPEGLLEPGTQLGDYRLLSVLHADDDIAIYEAEQISMQRRVALKILFRKHRRDPAWVNAFAEEARSRALVSQQNISLVYEAAQEQGVNFYTMELINGRSLASIAEAGEKLDDELAYEVLACCAEALRYLQGSGVRFRPLTASGIFVVGDTARIANPVKNSAAFESEPGEQMRLLAEALRPLIHGRRSSLEKRMIDVLNRMQGGERVDGIREVTQLIDALILVEKAEAESDYQAEVGREENRRAIKSGIIAGAAILAAGLLAMKLLDKGPEVRDLDKMVLIPAGKFPYQDGEPVEVKAFWIGHYEVTISQYARFLEALQASPELGNAVKHADQPATKANHKPENWDTYYPLALKGKDYAGSYIDQNCPVMGVDWWDAYAFAKWLGRRLPTEQEWERAGRARDNKVYPWGNELDLTKFNSGSDYGKVEGKEPGWQDNYRAWNPVDAIRTDVSDYAVGGMAGNVSEWTDSWDLHPDNPDKKVPYSRGASFNTTKDFELKSRRPSDSANDRKLFLGFRTASDVDPTQLPPPGTGLTPAAAAPADAAPPAAPAMEEVSSSPPAPPETPPAPAPAMDAAPPPPPPVQ